MDRCGPGPSRPGPDRKVVTEARSWAIAAGLIGMGGLMLVARPSTHFSWSELTTTSQGQCDNTPTLADAIRLIYLANWVLEPLRAQFGAIQVTSGYRSECVNAAIGGAANSYHRKGCAADVYSQEGYSAEQMASWLYQQIDLPLAEVIVERHTGHLHIAADVAGPAGLRKFLEFDGATYTSWAPT